MTILGKEITKQFVLKVAGFAAICLAVLGLTGYVYLIQHEKSQFATAEKEIDALYAQIVEKVGKPDQEKKEKTCGYASRVYERGPRSCAVSRYVLYEDKNINQANEMARTVSQTINIKPSRYAFVKYGTGEYKYEFAKEDERVIEQSLGSDIDLSFDDGCSIELVHPVVSSSYTDKFQVKSNENFLIGIVCGGPAMMEYFSVKD